MTDGAIFMEKDTVSQAALSKDVITGVAVSSAIFAVILLVPFVGFFFSLLLPLPVLFYRARDGRRTAGLIAALTITVMAVMFGGVSIDLLFFAGFLLIGLVLGELFDWHLPVEPTVAIATAAALVTGFVGLLVYCAVAGRGPVAVTTEYVAANLHLTLELYKKMGVSEDTLHNISGSFAQIQYVLVRIMPALAAATALFVTWTTLLLSRSVFARRDLAYPAFGSLNRWKAPEPLVWGAIASGLLMFLPIRGLKIIGINGAIMMMVIYFFQGIAIVSFFLDKKRLPPMFRFFLYSLIAVQQLLLLLVIGCGFFDIWLNFRKLETNQSR